MNKRLYKIEEGKMVDGVCGGIAEFFNIDPTIVRLIWALLCIFGGGGIIAYIAVSYTHLDVYKRQLYILILRNLTSFVTWQRI